MIQDSCSKKIADQLGLCLGAKGLVFTERDFAPEFFDLRSGLAGELFQKCPNYKLRVAIVLPAPEAFGERFSELAYEHASHNMIRFVRSKEEANAWLNRDTQHKDAALDRIVRIDKDWPN